MSYLDMCSRCDTLLRGLCLPHELSACPLRHALYCSFCASYGHDVRDCPDDPSSASGKRHIVIEDSEEAMTAFLVEKKIVVPKGRPLRIAVEAYASLYHRRVVYRPVSSAPSASSKRNPASK